MAMRPQKFIFAPKLPMTSSGKIARGQLADFLKSQDQTLEVYDIVDKAGADASQPLDPLEQAIARTWEAELSLPAGSITRNANFAQLGGHSVAALGVARRLNQFVQNNGLFVAASAPSDWVELFSPSELLSSSSLSEYALNLAARGIYSDTRIAENSSKFVKEILDALGCASRQPSCWYRNDERSPQPS